MLYYITRIMPQRKGFKQVDAEGSVGAPSSKAINSLDDMGIGKPEIENPNFEIGLRYHR